MNEPATTRTNIAELQRGAPQKPAVGMREISALPKQQQFPKMLEAFKKEIAIALPSHLNADRMARIALTCFRQNPTLAECEPQSVFACIVMASQLGLEPGLMGQAYLIPFNKKVKRNGRDEWVKECQLIPGYQGLVDLARRSGRIKSLEAHVVYANDRFECSFGLEPRLVHEPKWDGARGDFRLVYAVAHLTDGGVHVEVMSADQVRTIRDRSQNVQNAKKYNKQTPWDTDFDQMAIKTVLRRICKFLPKSVELASALALEAINARGRSQEIDLTDAIEGEFTNVAALEADDVDAADEAATCDYCQGTGVYVAHDGSKRDCAECEGTGLANAPSTLAGAGSESQFPPAADSGSAPAPEGDAPRTRRMQRGVNPATNELI